nr:acyl-CoA dehydrogenase family protein [Nocardioides alcanivorans]
MGADPAGPRPCPHRGVDAGQLEARVQCRQPLPADASATKVYGSELATEVYRALMEIVGPHAGITADSPDPSCSAAWSATSAAHS